MFNVTLKIKSVKNFLLFSLLVILIVIPKSVPTFGEDENQRLINEVVVSPDKSLIAATISQSYTQKKEIWVYEITKGEWKKITDSALIDTISWSPDSTQICFREISKERSESIFSICFVDIVERNIKVLTNKGANSFPSWSPQGDLIAFASWKDSNPNKHLWIIKSDGTGEFALTSPGELASWEGWVWSSDGKIFFIQVKMNKKEYGQLMFLTIKNKK